MKSTAPELPARKTRASHRPPVFRGLATVSGVGPARAAPPLPPSPGAPESQQPAQTTQLPARASPRTAAVTRTLALSSQSRQPTGVLSGINQ